MSPPSSGYMSKQARNHHEEGSLNVSPGIDKAVIF
jgi:hypothetical protein